MKYKDFLIYILVKNWEKKMRKTIVVFIVLVLFGICSGQQLPNLPIPLGAGTAEVWQDNIYFFGGSNNWAGSIVYPRIYKFDGQNWAYHDSIPDNNLWDVESVLINNEVYLVSGWPSGAAALRKYNMVSGQWQYLADSPNLTQDWGITAEHLNGLIYLFNSSGEVFEYNISSNSWNTKTTNLATGTWDLSSILFQNEIYIIGWDDSSFYKYTPASDSWTELAKSPYQVGACAIGIIDNLVYCVGGNSDGDSPADYRSVIVYDITSDSWNTDSLQISGKRHWMATAAYLGGLYVLGGIDSTANSVNIVEEIVPQGTSTNLENISQNPTGFGLGQNYPNPFNATTIIPFSISAKQQIRIEIFDITGNNLSTISDKVYSAGDHSVHWDASEWASGIYFYRISAGKSMRTGKMILMK